MRVLPPLGAAVLLAAPAGAWALGLGDIQLHSALNQPFSAEIPLLSASADELESLKVTLASRETFDRYGLDRPSDLSDLEFKIGRNAAGQNVVLVSSAKRIGDPFVTMLVEATWARGRLLREYTVLLDPPTLLPGPSEQAPIRQAEATSPGQGAAGGAIARAPAASAAAAGGTGEASTSASTSASSAAGSAGSTRFAAAQGGAGGSAGGTYGPVRRDETLWGIASSLKPADVTTNQMMVALYAANPDAFGANMNRLLRGATLKVPDRDALQALSPEAATAEVRRQASSWQSQAAASRQGASPSGAEAASSGAASAEAEQARLRLVPPQNDSAAAGTGGAAGAGAASESGAGRTGAGAGGAAGTESSASAGAASEAEVSDLRGEVQALRGQLEQNRRLLELRDQQLQTLQNQLASSGKAGAAGAAATAGAPAAAASTAAPGVALESEQVFADDAGKKAAEAAQAAQAAAGSADQSAAAKPAAAEEGGAAQPGAQAADASQPAAAAGQAPESAAAAAAGGAAAPKPAAASGAAAAAAHKAPAPSLASRVLGWIANPILLIGLGLGAVLLTAVWYLRHRREDDVDDVTGRWDALEAEIEEETRAATARVRRPADDSSMIVEERRRVQPAGDDEAGAAHGDFDDDGTLSSQTVINLDQADPVAEADFHMAYGLYDQAAELVSKALEAEPGRRDLKLKLLEVYFVWGNKDAFLESARSLHDEMGGAPDADWDKVLIMGKQICPDEALFAEDAQGGAVDLDLQGAGSTEIDFALDDKESDEFGLDFGADLDLELAETGERLGKDAEADDEEDDEIEAARSQDLAGSLDIGEQTAAGLEAALFAGDEDDAESTGTAYDALAATQESPTVEHERDNGDWTLLLEESSEEDEAEANTVETPTVETAGPDAPTVETPTVETPYGFDAGADTHRDLAAEAADADADADAPTVETPTYVGSDAPTMETPTVEASFAGLGEAPTVEQTGIGASASSSDHTEEIDLDDLGLSLGDLEDLPEDIGELPGAGDATGDETREQAVLAADEGLLSATGVTEVLQEDEIGDVLGEDEAEGAKAGDDSGVINFDSTGFEFEPGLDAVDAADSGRESEIEAELDAAIEADADEADAEAEKFGFRKAAAHRREARSEDEDEEQSNTSVLPDYEPTLLAAFDDHTYVGTEIIEQRREGSGDTSLVRALAGYEGGPADGDGLDLNLEDLSAALEGGDTVEQPRGSSFAEDFFGGGETPLDLDVGADAIGADDPTGRGEASPLDPQTMTEIGTKLDLARAYIDMGDPEGARSILEEVLDEGDTGQRREAQGLIDALSA